MADQVFDLTQTGQQVQDIINDASKVKDAGAQTTLTTESILLKDVNGNYHKILKSSFTEAIRDTLAGLLVNNDKGTTISRIAAIASGDFGSITPTNLASVLGVGKANIPTRTELAKKVATIVLNNDYSRVGFLFAVGGYGVMAMGVVSLRTSGSRTSPTANIIKNVLDSTQCKFIVVKEEASATFTVYVTGSYTTNTGGNILILPMDGATKINFGSNVEVSSLTAYATLSL